MSTTESDGPAPVPDKRQSLFRRTWNFLLELRITDAGGGSLPAVGAVGPVAGGGHGLIGMRERAALFGGTLTALPRRDHGFEVRATLPV